MSKTQQRCIEVHAHWVNLSQPTLMRFNFLSPYICALFISFIIPNGFSNTLNSQVNYPMTTYTQETNVLEFKEIKKLKQPLSTTGAIKELVTSAKGDAYQLSMALYAGALSGNRELFYEILPTMMLALNKIPKDGKQDSFIAWLLGRVLLSAEMIGAEDLARATQIKLARLLSHLTTLDACSAWAWGYLAAYNDKQKPIKINEEEYKKNAAQMFHQATVLTEAYTAIRDAKTVDPQENVQSKKEDVLWTWIMALQAAANANDTEGYENAKQQIINVTKEKSVANAIFKGLPAAMDYSASGFGAWGGAIVNQAAIKMGDDPLVDSLKDPLEKAIKNAGEAYTQLQQKNPENARRALAEHTLAKTTYELANQLKADKSQTLSSWPLRSKL